MVSPKKSAKKAKSGPGALDPASIPLEGVHCIEASAGTGKTHQLCNLYIRLVAEKGLSVERILVVTFTRAAAQELSERLRAGLVRALDVFEGRSSKEPYFQTLAKRNPQTGALFLRHALKRFDQASIFTIHGFCQRLLSRYAFESQAPFDLALHTDSRPFYSQTAKDFWRTHFYNAPRHIAYRALKSGLAPTHYEGLLNSWSKHSNLAIKTGQKLETMPSAQVFEDSAARVRESWPGLRKKVMKLLAHKDLYDKDYGKSAIPKDGSPSARQTKLEQLQSDMDKWADTSTPAFPVFDNFLLFTLSKIQDSVYGKKNGNKLDCGKLEPFFALCEDCLEKYHDLLENSDLYLAHLDCEIFDFAAQHLAKAKQKAGAIFYTDLIELVKKALEGPHAKALEKEMAQAYGAALIDEFQDTDSSQYAIFQKIFARPGKALYLIGDPKQAIYGFRGADLFSYLDAANKADMRHTLNENWRSEPDLIKGVNTVFGKTKKPFVLDDIEFYPALAAPKKQPPLVLPGKKGPLAIWYCPPIEKDGGLAPTTKGIINPLIYQAIVARASQLLDWGRKGKAFVGDEPLAEKHMAVLTQSNKQAIETQQHLRAAGINSVLYTNDYLFNAPQAGQMLRLLEALARPRDIGAIRGALATPLMGWSAKEIASLEEDGKKWEKVQARFAKGHERWRELGFFPMLFHFFRDEAVFERLLAGPDGARALTNVLHMAEVVFAAEKESRLGMSTLLKWLARALQEDSSEDEENQLRLESDALAMQVITIHRSKGLQFPVVFCPFLLDGLASNKGSFFYHDPDNDGQLTLCLKDPGDNSKALSDYENLAERIRLSYVALTRARNYCAFAWGPINATYNSPLAYIVHGAPQNAKPHELVSALCAQTKALNPASDFEQALNSLAEESDGAISVEELPSTIVPLGPEKPFEPEAMTCRAFDGSVDCSYRISSFSSLVSKVSHLKDSAGWDEPDEPALAPGPGPDPASDIAPEEPSHKKALDIFDFPRGPHAGTMLHALFEETDFDQADLAAVKKTASRVLARFGFDSEWAGSLAQMFMEVTACPLDLSIPGLALNRIARSKRLDEMEFFLPAKTFYGQDLFLALKDVGSIPGMENATKALASLNLAPVRGFIRGFVDCVFCHQGRYFLLDYKSNHLGDSVEDYNSRALAQAMISHHYYLQYHIYALALSRHLAGILPGYDYEKHFGGVFYLFLRGMNPAKGPEYGVFKDRPPLQRILELEKRLCP
ncbi:MAG: exodeoxyribonuclease V subunit beta [Desulfatibacillaceae bacterium]|nr:exodeoxyribonuclease V subunit beta [Desulfatibacillaceae bacterium]